MTEPKPLTKFECEQWRVLLDTLMHDANLATEIRWKPELRALATIDKLRTDVTDLLAARGRAESLALSVGNPGHGAYASHLHNPEICAECLAEDDGEYFHDIIERVRKEQA